MARAVKKFTPRYKKMWARERERQRWERIGLKLRPPGQPWFHAGDALLRLLGTL